MMIIFIHLKSNINIHTRCIYTNVYLYLNKMCGFISLKKNTCKSIQTPQMNKLITTLQCLQQDIISRSVLFKLLPTPCGKPHSILYGVTSLSDFFLYVILIPEENA